MIASISKNILANILEIIIARISKTLAGKFYLIVRRLYIYIYILNFGAGRGVGEGGGGGGGLITRSDIIYIYIYMYIYTFKYIYIMQGAGGWVSGWVRVGG